MTIVLARGVSTTGKNIAGGGARVKNGMPPKGSNCSVGK